MSDEFAIHHKRRVSKKEVAALPSTRDLVVAFALLITLSVPTRGHAQGAVTPHSDSSLHQVISRISTETGRSVRIANNATGRLEGRSIRLRGDSVLVIGDLGAHAVLLTDIDSILVQRGSRAGVFGALAGVPCAVFGALLSAFLATDPDSNGRHGRGAGGAIVGGLAGGVSCGLVGAGVGSLFRRWQLEYAHPRGS